MSSCYESRYRNGHEHGYGLSYHPGDCPSHGVYHGALVQSVGQVVGFQAAPMVSYGIPGQVQLMPHFVEPLMIQPVMQPTYHHVSPPPPPQPAIVHHYPPPQQPHCPPPPAPSLLALPTPPVAVDFGNIPVCGDGLPGGCISASGLDLGNLNSVPMCGNGNLPSGCISVEGLDLGNWGKVPCVAPVSVSGGSRAPHTFSERKYHFVAGADKCCGCNQQDCRSCRARKENKRHYA